MALQHSHLMFSPVVQYGAVSCCIENDRTTIFVHVYYTNLLIVAVDPTKTLHKVKKGTMVLVIYPVAKFNSV